jgi:HD-like signal output (HDOD) protein
MYNFTSASALFKKYSTEISADSLLAPGWKSALADLNRMDYYSCPASSKFHLCIKGGLLLHSVSVARTALRLARKTLAPASRSRILMAALLHDTGKCGLWDGRTLQPRYRENLEECPESGYRKKYWTPYHYTESEPMFAVRDLSAIYAARWGCPYDIIQAVLVHDGPYDEANNKYFMKSSPLSSLLTTADFMSATLLETKTELSENPPADFEIHVEEK